MIPYLILTSLLAWVALGGLVAGVLLVSVGVPGLASRLAVVRPRFRERLLWVAVVLPWALAVAVPVIALLPSLLGLLVPEWCHCRLHSHYEIHICLIHLPEGPLSVWILVSPLLLAGLAVASLSRLAYLISAAHTLARRIGATPESHSPLLVNDPRPMSFTSGVLEPVIIITSGLWERCDESVRRVVLAHEQAHVRRRDALRKIIYLACSTPFPGAARTLLVKEFVLALEEQCDAEAVRESGSLEQIALSLLHVERIVSGQETPDLAPAINGGSLSRRVEALLRTEGEWVEPPLFSAYLFALVLLSLVISGPFHHGLETLFSLLWR